MLRSHNASGRISFAQMKQDESFLISHISSVTIEVKRSLQRKEHHSQSEMWGILSYVMRLQVALMP